MIVIGNIYKLEYSVDFPALMIQTSFTWEAACMSDSNYALEGLMSCGLGNAKPTVDVFRGGV